MCNSVQKDTLAIPPTGFAYKLLKITELGNIRSAVRDIQYDKNPFEHYIDWKPDHDVLYRDLNNQEGFCFFPTVWDAEKFLYSNGWYSRLLFKVHYRFGIGMHKDSDACSIILLAKSWMVADDKPVKYKTMSEFRDCLDQYYNYMDNFNKKQSARVWY